MPVGAWRHYAVLLPLVEKDEEIYILFEVRSQHLKVQPGEIGFPGGGIEEGETPAYAALRETAEELGVDKSAVRIISELDYLIDSRKRIVYCFLGTIDQAALSIAKFNPAEVDEVFLVPLRWLLANNVSGDYIWKDPGTGKTQTIWGMTAHLTAAFLTLLQKDVGPFDSAF